MLTLFVSSSWHVQPPSAGTFLVRALAANPQGATAGTEAHWSAFSCFMTTDPQTRLSLATADVLICPVQTATEPLIGRHSASRNLTSAWYQAHHGRRIIFRVYIVEISTRIASLLSIAECLLVIQFFHDPYHTLSPWDDV
jgi:hypothetical protein